MCKFQKIPITGSGQTLCILNRLISPKNAISGKCDNFSKKYFFLKLNYFRWSFTSTRRISHIWQKNFDRVHLFLNPPLSFKQFLQFLEYGNKAHYESAQNHSNVSGKQFKDQKKSNRFKHIFNSN